MAMTAEMKAEILAFLEQREQEKKRNRTTYQRVYEPYRERMDAFDYEHIYHYSTGGQTTVSFKYGYPIQNAMGTVLITWFLSHDKKRIRFLSAFLVGATWPMSFPVALLFSLF